MKLSARLLSCLLLFGFWQAGRPNDGTGARGATALDLPFAVATSGTISLPGQQDRFTFTGAVGQRLFFDTLRLTSENLFVRLIAPSEMEASGSSATSSEPGPFYLLETGVYTLKIAGSGDATGSYNFRLLDAGTAPVLTLYSSNAVSLNPSSRTELFQFAGIAGQSIALQSLSYSTNSAWWSLINPANQVIAGATIDSDLGTNLLQQSGTYLLVVAGTQESGPVVDFAFQLIDVSEPPVASSGFGLVHSGSLGADETNTFNLTATAGTVVYYDSLVPEGSAGITRHLIGPDGSIVADHYGNVTLDGTVDWGLYSLPHSGTYMLQLVGSSGGSYSFRVLNLETDSLPLVLGSSVAGSLTQGYRTDVYRFEGSPGQMLYYDALDGAINGAVTRTLLSLGQPWMIMGEEEAARDYGLLTLTLPGTYYLTQRSRTSDTLVGYHFRLLDLAQAPVTPLVLNTFVTNSLATASQTALYQFYGTAGQRLFFDSLGSEAAAAWALLDSLGHVCEAPLNTDFTLTLPRTGTHVLKITSAGAASINYAFRVITAATTSDTLTLGTLTSGQLTTVGEEHHYTFTGAAGQRLFYDALQSDCNKISVRLLDPQGNPVYLYQGACDDSVPFTLVQAGTYTLALGSWSDALGSYAFRLIDLSQAPALPLDYNTVHSGSNTLSLSATVFTFAGTAGQRLFFDDVLPDGQKSDAASWQVYDARNGSYGDSTALGNDFELTLTCSGTNILVLRSSATNAFEYSFRIVTPITITSPLLLGATVSNSFGGPGDEHRYTFSGVAGQRLYYDALSTGGDNVNVSLLGPNGSWVRGGNSDSDFGLLTLPRAGTYTLVQHNSTDQATNYWFRLRDLADQPALNLGSSVTNQLNPLTQAQFHRLVGVAGQKIQLHNFFASSSNVNWTFYGPTNNPLAWTSVSQDVSDLILPQSGTYALAVRSSESSADPLDYQFLLTDVSDEPVSAAGFGTYTGTVAAGDTNIITFTAQAGTRIYIDSLTNNNSTSLLLLDPDGQPVFGASSVGESDPGMVTLLRSGTYRLFVLGEPGGDYSLRLLNLDTDSTVLTFGTRYSDSLTTGFQTVIYKFNGTDGQRIFYDSLEADRDPVYVQLFAPSGASFIQPYYNYADYDFGPWTLTESGTYYLIIDSRMAETNHYTFRMLDLNQAPTLSTDLEVTNGTGLVPVPANCLTLTGSYVNTSLVGVDDLDWRSTQTIAGSRTDPMVNFYTTNWGSRATVGLTGGSDDNWSDFSAQWDGLIAVTNANTRLYLFNTGGSQMWVDRNQDSVFDGSELSCNVLGAQSENPSLGIASQPLLPGTYRMRLQFVAGWPSAQMVLYWDNGHNLGPYEAQFFRFTANTGPLFFNSLQGANATWHHFRPAWDYISAAAEAGADFESFSDTAGTNLVLFSNDSGSGQPYSFRIVAPEVVTNSLSLGNTYNTSLTAREQRYYTFSATAGQRLYYDALDPFFDSTITWSLLSPGSNTVLTTLFRGYDRGPVTLTESGTYLLVAHNHTDTTLGWNFRLLDVSAQPFLSFDTTNSLSVALGTTASLFQFDSLAHLPLFLDALTSIDGYWWLYGPNNANLGGGILGQDFAVENPPLTATYVLVLNRHYGIDSYDFSFRLIPGNHAPALPPVANEAINELKPFSITPIVMDPESDNERLTFSLDAGAPAGAMIDLVTGTFSWTPTEAQGPGIYPITVRVTDNGIPPLADSTTFTVIVHEVNTPPVLSAQVDQVLTELATLTVTNTAMDADLPANPLSYALLNPPSGASIDANGVITWTPTEAQGPSTNLLVTVVTDTNTSAVTAQQLSTTNSFTVIVHEVNTPPVLLAQVDQVLTELTTLRLTNSATDADLPANPLSYALLNPPPGASIDANGVITWTPTEAQGPSTNLIVTVVTDTNASAATAQQLSTTNSFTVIIHEVNTPPVLLAQVDQVLTELTTLRLTNSAMDADLPANPLSYALLNPPAGASIDATGVITWTPTEAQGPSTNLIVTVVTDTNANTLTAQQLSTTNSFTVIVQEINTAPVLPAQVDQVLTELTTLTITNSATDADLPANPLNYTLLNPPAGASIDANGVITWTPSEAQGPSTNFLVTVVTDTNASAITAQQLSTTNSFAVIVQEINTAPVLLAQVDQVLTELTTLTLTNSATDADLPANPLSYALLNPPAGASIDASGVITWTPTEAQGPSTNLIVTVVTDTNASAITGQQLSTTNSFTVIVQEVNTPPVLPAQADQVLTELTALTLTNSATDADLPANPLNYALLNPPAGASIDANGVITWTPTEAQGPSTNLIVTVVTDTNASAITAQQLSATNSFTVIVHEVNTAPVLLAQVDRTINELTTLRVTNSATDADLPANPLSYALLNPPAGASIDASGVITWTPTELQGPSTNLIVTVVTDTNASAITAQQLSATNSFTVIVQEMNTAPVLPAQVDRTINELTTLRVTNSATDADLPANPLSYALLNPPAGASIDASGVITWTPTEAQGPSTNLIVTVVTDTNASAITAQQLSATNSFTVIVQEINTAPVLPAQVDRIISELTTLRVTNSVIDADLPANPLSYALLNPPAGASIDANGVITWTPSEAQGPSTNLLVTVVTDTNASAITAQQLSATNSFTVIVQEVNTAPVLSVSGNRTVNPGQVISFTAVATDADLPTNSLVFSLLNPPAGASIDSSSGQFYWRPTLAQANTTNLVQVQVSDASSYAATAQQLSDTKSFTVIVSPLGPVLLTPVGATAGQFQLSISGTPGPDYTIQASTNLASWSDLGTTNPPSLPFSFTDTNAGPLNQRFYRVLLKP